MMLIEFSQPSWLAGSNPEPSRCELTVITAEENDKVLSHFIKKGGIMRTILHFIELICHVVGGSDRSLYEVLDYNGNKLHSGAKV